MMVDGDDGDRLVMAVSGFHDVISIDSDNHLTPEKGRMPILTKKKIF